jgi:hypothetical protein
MLMAVERRYVMELRHMVSRMREKVKDMEAAAPRVMLIP